MAVSGRSAIDVIRSLGQAAGQLSKSARRRIQRAGCGPQFSRPRGCRAGLHVQRRRACPVLMSQGFHGDVNSASCTEGMRIPIITGRRVPTFSKEALSARLPVRVAVQTFQQFVPCFLNANLRGGIVHKTDEMAAVFCEYPGLRHAPQRPERWATRRRCCRVCAPQSAVCQAVGIGVSRFRVNLAAL